MVDSQGAAFAALISSLVSVLFEPLQLEYIY